MSKQNQNKQIRVISMNPVNNKITISFDEAIVDSEIESDAEGEESEESVMVNEHYVRSPRRPHKDFTDAMKKLRKYALDICEMIFESKAVTFYNVIEVKIAGDMAQHTSRVVFTVSKEVKWSGKHIKWKTPQVTMYGESEYGKVEEMTKLVEALIQEAWEYLGGKAEEDNQLPLFPTVELSLQE